MSIAITLLGMLLGLSATETHERSIGMDDQYYVVVFGVNKNGAMIIPATNPPGQPHYDAMITVFRIVGDQREIVTEPFTGQWTPNGCFEDDPEALVKYAMSQAGARIPRR